LVKDDVPTLIDAGARAPQAYERLTQRLADNGLRVSDIGRVLLTHGHLDHIGLLAGILAESNAEIYAHPYVVEQYANYEEGLEDSMDFLVEISRKFGAPDEKISQLLKAHSSYKNLAEQIVIKNAVADCERVGEFIACHMPGHSAADVVYYDPKRKIAFGGDHLLRNISPNPLLRRTRPGETRARSLVEYQHSLHRTHDLDIEWLYPGHGEPFADHRRVIDSLLERHERRTSEILAMLEEKPLTPYDIMMRLFPKLDMSLLHFGLSVAVGHLEVLEERGLAAPEEFGAITRFRASGTHSEKTK
jgi:glyoxylase-like metal-dependent hydrolase (beta-lactamase superfamily II)